MDWTERGGREGGERLREGKKRGRVESRERKREKGINIDRQ